MNGSPEIIITVRDLKIGYGEKVILQNVNFQVRRGEVFVILGGSGCGKSTLLKNLIGLYTPLAGEVWIEEGNLVAAKGDERLRLLRKFGVMYQSGALFGSMTVLENVRLALDEFTALPEPVKDLVALAKLKLVGLGAASQKMPSELSGGMQKRAAIARAMALDPRILFLDEPSAGLDPVTSAGSGPFDQGTRASFQDYIRHRHARTREHLQHRRPRHHARRPDPDNHCRRSTRRAARTRRRPVGAPFFQPRTGFWPDHYIPIKIMSTATNDFKLGLFTLCGLAILIAGILAFGARSYFEPTSTV